jgi:hypothetical protein
MSLLLAAVRRVSSKHFDFLNKQDHPEDGKEKL